MTSNPTSGNFLILTIGVVSNYPMMVSMVNSSGAGSSWYRIANNSVLNSYSTEIWLGLVSSTPVDKNITITTAATMYAYYTIGDACEYSGISNPVLDKTALNQTTSTHGDTGTTATTTASNELWIGSIYGVSSVGNGQSAPTNGFTLLDGLSSAYSTNYASEGFYEKIVSATGTADTGCLFVSNSNWKGVIITLKAANTVSLSENGSMTLSLATYSISTKTMTKRGLNSLGLTQSSIRSISFSEGSGLSENLAFNFKKTVEFFRDGQISASLDFSSEFVKNIGKLFSGLMNLAVSVDYVKMPGFSLGGLLSEAFRFRPLPQDLDLDTMVSQNLNLDPNYYLFGGGRYIGLVIAIIALFLINWLHKYSFIITVTLGFLIAILYFKQTPPLVWEGALMSLEAVVLLVTGALRMKH